MSASFRYLIGSIALCAITCSTAAAQETQTSDLPTFTSSQLELTPYVWALHINSDDQIASNGLNANIPIGRILSSLKGLIEVETVARYKHAFVFGDGRYASLQLSPRGNDPDLDHVNLQTGLVTIEGGFSFGPFPLPIKTRQPLYITLQPFGGASYTDLAVTGRSKTPTTLVRLAEEWWMPVAGTRIDGRQGNYVARLEGNFSKFGNNQNGEQIFGSVGYELQKHRAAFPSINIGYRYLYEKKAPTPEEMLRAKLQGPLIFVTFHFK